MIVTFDTNHKYCISDKSKVKTEQKCTAKWNSKMSVDQVEFEEDTSDCCVKCVRIGTVKQMASIFHNVDSNIDV